VRTKVLGDPPQQRRHAFPGTDGLDERVEQGVVDRRWAGRVAPDTSSTPKLNAT
jgi:hypothetical protein